MRILSLALLLLFVPASWAAPSPQTSTPRLVIVSWDGAADWVIDRMLAENRLPNLARLAKTGARAEHSTPAFPSKTAVGHAAIWTGAYGDVNGVTGNSVPLLPRAEHTILERRSGYDSASLAAEPLWITALAAGRRVAVLSGTQAFPPDRDIARLKEAGIPLDRYVSFSGFEHPIARSRVVGASDLVEAKQWSPRPRSSAPAREVTMQVGESELFALVFDDPGDPVAGYDTVLLRQGSRDAAKAVAEALLKPREAANDTKSFSPRFRVTKGDLFGYTYLRLFDLAPDGSRMTLYQRSVNGLKGAASVETVEVYLDAYGGFHDEDTFKIYLAGGLGAQLFAGGDGTAERRVVELVRLDVEMLERGTRFAIHRWKPDVLFHYTPTIDGASHTWIGVLDPESPAFDAALAERIWPYYVEVVALQDRWLGAILDAVGESAVVAVVSDHGMSGNDKWFYPNAVLAKAGLLAANDGQIDLSRTQALVPPWSDFFVVVNGTDWKQGVVPPEEREAVLEAATKALLESRDPETGRPIVTAVLRPDRTVGLGIGGPAGGDLYLELAYGYYPYNRVTSGAVAKIPIPIGSGEHGYLPLRRKMQAIFYAGGGPMPRGIAVSGVRQIDIAPTLARLVGLPAPRDAYGHVIGEMLPRGER